MLSAIRLMFRLMLRIAAHVTNTKAKPINEKKNSDVRLVNTFKSKVTDTIKPINQRIISAMVPNIIQVVRFDIFTFRDCFMVV